MPILLHIDTAGERASVGVGNEDGVIAFEESTDQKLYASFVQPALQRVLQKASLSFGDINAVCVVNGPGSYTGLRVGLASGKGLSYATGAPLILLNTLSVMAFSAINQSDHKKVLYCPVIDARRNEVFTAVFDAELNPLLPPQPMILEADSFSLFLSRQKVMFFGSGHNKCEKIIRHENAIFANVQYGGNDINSMGYKTYLKRQFADVAYSQPFYTKEFFSPGQ